MLTKLLLVLNTLLFSSLLCAAVENINIAESIYDNETDYFYMNEDEYDGNSCSITQFINNFNVSQYLPDDYKPVTSDEELSRFVPHINDTFARGQRIIDWAIKLSNNYDLVGGVKLLVSRITDMLYELDLPSECLASILRIGNGIKDQSFWALKFYDSYGNLMPPGLMEGRMSSYGEYDECLSISSPPEDGKIVYGKYCTIYFLATLPPLQSYNKEYEQIARQNEFFQTVEFYAKMMKLDNYLYNPILKSIEGMDSINGETIRMGICIPHTCEAKDVERAFNKLQFPITRVPAKILEQSCDVNPESKSSYELDDYQKLSVIVFSVLIVLVVLSTCFEVILRFYTKSSEKTVHLNKKWTDVLLSFSAITNTNKLLEINNRFAALDTIRLFLTFGVYSLQSYDFTIGFGSIIMRRTLTTTPMKLLSHNRYWFARTAGVWIDGFMLNMGLMLSYSMLNKLKQSNGKFSYANYMWKRWLRLSVSMSGTFLVIYLMPLTGDGPIWHYSSQWLQPACREKWSILSSFLYFSNWNSKLLHNYKLLDHFPLCNPPTWFLSASTQLYAFAPILFLSLYKWPKFGIVLSIISIAIGVFTAISPKLLLGNLTYFEPTRIPSIKDGLIYFLNYHTNPLQYVCTLSIGLLTGYLIRKKPDLYIGGRRVEIVLWIISLTNIFLFYCWNNTFWVQNESPPEISVLLWFSLGKLIYGLSLAWISFACCTGRGGIVNSFLSMRILQPVAKLSYGIYLLRLPVIFHRIFTVRYNFAFTDFQAFQNIVADYLMTAILAYLLHILLESPFINLIKIMETKHTKSLESNLNGDKCIHNKNVFNGSNLGFDDTDINNNNEHLTETDEKDSSELSVDKQMVV